MKHDIVHEKACRWKSKLSFGIRTKKAKSDGIADMNRNWDRKEKKHAMNKNDTQWNRNTQNSEIRANVTIFHANDGRIKLI